MKITRLTHQAGYALILMLLGLMGVGGVVLAGFTQQARQDLELQRLEHNQNVLRQAKQALLMFAYSYPDTTGGGPGRLPCPDVDNDGTVDGPGTCNQVGRFPYADARLKTIRNGQLVDASGETLWYAVSDTFDNVAGGGTINSDTTGAITLVDRSGGILYDGNGAGIAAVIIAPGPIGKRDNDANGSYEYTQVRATGPQQVDPRNYLDTFNGFDNSVFNNGESDSNDDGFILGPVYDINEDDIVVNDQIIIITADEVAAMAEKRVLEEYRDAIENYRQTLWAAPGDRRYPWLAAYSDTTDLDVYDARPGETSGRVPFIDYFVDDNSPHSVIVGDLQIEFDLHVNYNSMVDNADPFDPTYIAAASAVVSDYPESDQTVNISNARVSFSRISFDGLADVTTDNIGTFIVQDSGTSAITAHTYPTNTERRYFWDGCPTCFEPADGWEMCPVNAGLGTDCALNPAGTAYVAFSNWSAHADVRIRMIEFQYIDPDFVLELDYSPAPGVTAPTQSTAVSHSRIQYTFDEDEVTMMAIADPAEPETRNFFDIKVSMCDQDNFVGNNLNLVSLGNPDVDTVACTVDLDLDVTTNYHDDLVVTVDWFPPLPRWISDNGWDESVMMTYAPDFAPGGIAACTPEDGDITTGAADDCLVVTNLAGPTINDVVSLLVLGGENDLSDGDDLNDDGDYLDVDEVAPDLDFSNDLFDIFEPENYSGIGPYPTFPYVDPDPPSDTGWGLVFDKREDVVMDRNAADTVLVLDRL